ncbi:MAG: hypothetical protein GX320_01495 [Tissierellia bacterium]|nr:hypothetical protein [Tissierellia bacterium]
MDKREDDNFIKKHNIRWVVLITIWTFFMAIIFTIITEGLVENLNILLAFIILISIILIGIFFDIIGIAVTTAKEKPFHAMAANKIDEAKYAIKLVRNASQVSNFCNDVIGDISGIVSGAIGATIIYKLTNIYNIKNASALSIIITSLVAAFTVGGKAFGKSIAMFNSEKIIFETARVLNFVEKKFRIDILPDKKNKNNKIDKYK